MKEGCLKSAGQEPADFAGSPAFPGSTIVFATILTEIYCIIQLHFLQNGGFFFFLF